ncbi:uncharacterized protein LOC117176642 [Belonocnema kinseyi]|uniref:uncharacterized protein LOC117176642 n=1 Tax=Belonocnema kinseyi TaxID=2817044 RepID=UPI00143D8EF1|nr:uncharacterized protein LOC117176642 [Belonocnema kinseyi]
MHFGFERALLHELQFFDKGDVTEIVIKIHFDGLPLSKSLKDQLWTQLGKITKPQPSRVFIIRAYYGRGNQKLSSEFLKCFVEEYKNLHETGFLYKGRKGTLTLSQMIADSPARSLITCTKSHNGYSACPRCAVEGQYEYHKMIFLGTDSQLKTDETFANRTDEEHHVGDSPLEEMQVKMVSEIPLYVMHLIDIGVVPRMIGSLLSGRHSGRLSGKQMKDLSGLPLSLREWIPNEFVPNREVWMNFYDGRRQNFVFSALTLVQQLFNHSCLQNI